MFKVILASIVAIGFGSSAFANDPHAAGAGTGHTTTETKTMEETTKAGGKKAAKMKKKEKTTTTTPAGGAAPSDSTHQ